MDVHAEVDGLYRLPPEEFVAERNDLVKRLRAAGDRQAADEVKGLRRPSVPAWAINQLAHRDAEGIAALDEVRNALARAQRRLLSGVRDSGLREAMARRREVVRRLTEETDAALRESERDPALYRQVVNGTLEAAAVDPEAGEQVRRGRLERELAPPSGFGNVAGLELIAPEPESEGEVPAGDQQPSAPSEGAAERAREVAAARQAVEQDQRRLRDLRAAADADQDAADAARARADQSEVEATRLQRRAELARRQAEADERAARDAAREAEQAQAAAERQAGEVAEAERRLEALERGAAGTASRPATAGG